MQNSGDKNEWTIILNISRANQLLITVVERFEAESRKENFTGYIAHWESISQELRKMQDQGLS